MQTTRWIIMIHVHAHTGTAETFSAIIPKTINVRSSWTDHSINVKGKRCYQ